MNLLITGAWQEAEKYIETIEQMGHKVHFLQFEKDELPCEYDWIEGIIGNGIFLSHPIEKFINLQYIQLTSAGFDRVPMDYVKEHNITINNARGVYSAPMAEYAVSGVLQLYKQGRFFMENQKAHRWEKRRDLKELSGQSVCILGCGSVGTECAKRFEAFECKVYGVDIVVRDIEHYSHVYHLNDVKEALSKADIVVITLPLTDETHHMFNEEIFSAMKTGTVLVNIARGALVDTDELITALHNKLGGAVLDVFEEEPVNKNSPLWDMENVIITPHNSFVGNENQNRLNEMIIKNFKRGLSNE